MSDAIAPIAERPARRRAPTPHASFVGEATFSGCFAICERPRADLLSCLPAGFGLADPRNERADTHSVVFAFGTHTRSATRFGGFDLRLGIVYREVGIFIPWVKRGPERELYVARMYSSFYPAVWNGNTHYGFAKELAEIHQVGSHFRVDAGRRPLLEGLSDGSGEWRLPSEGSVPCLAEVRAMFALPVLGRRADGRLVRSRFNFEFGPAHVRPADAWLDVVGALAPGIEPGEYGDRRDGSLEVRGMIWRLSWPESRLRTSRGER